MNGLLLSSFRQRLLVLLLLVAATGCSHDTSMVDGPLLTDRFGGFLLLEPLMVSQQAADFANGESIIFSAEFNKQVNWVLEITGTTSGAVKRFEGFSRAITDENARWRGGTTELPFFKAEDCTVVLTVLNEEGAEPLTTEVTVLSPRIYEGDVVADFEANAGSDIFFGNFEFELTTDTGRSTEVPAAEGDFFYLFRGTDNVVTNFFVGLIDIKASITGETYFPVPTTVPEDLFFNMFLYSFGTPNTIAVVQLIVDTNGTGAFEDGQDEAFPYGDLPVDWEGWQAFSKPVSEIGLTQAQVQEIVAVRVLLISDENNQPNPPLEVDYGVDYLTFTAGGPLEL